MSTQFRQVGAFFSVVLKNLVRSPGTLFLGFFFPMVFILVFGFLSTTQGVTLRVGMVPSSLQQYDILREGLLNFGDLELVISDEVDLRDRVQTRSLDGYLLFEPNTVKVVTSGEDSYQSDLLLSYVNQTVANYSLRLDGVATAWSVVPQPLQSGSVRLIDFVLPGVIGFALLSAAVSGTSVSLLTLRKTKALKRLFTTPARPSLFIIGHALARLVFSYAQTLILLAVAMGFFSFRLSSGFAGVLPLSLVLVVGVCAFLGLGYVVAGVTTSDEQAVPLSQIIILPQILLAGSFFSVEFLPGWMQMLAQLLPLYHFNEAFRYVSLQGAGLLSVDLWRHMGILLLWTLTIYLLAGRVLSVSKIKD